MRGATQCARRLKQLLRSLRTKLGKASRPSAGDAITQMILGVFSRDVPESKAREALDRLRAMVVDYNELRVVPPIETAEVVGELPDARLKCEDLSRALNGVFACEHEVSLDRLRDLPRREVIEYLDSIDGLDAYSRARVRLLGLHQHAIPLDEAMWAYARKTRIVDRRCPLEEAQAFLERRLAEDEALEFVALLEKQAWAELGPAVRDGEVERIRSIPPDRTARNMLQLVASGRAGAVSASGSESVASHEGGTRAAVSSGQKAAKPAKRAKAAKSAKKPTSRSSAAKSTAKPKAKAAAKRKSKAQASARRKPKAKVKPKSKVKRRTKSRHRSAARGKPKARKAARARATRRARGSAVRARSA